MFFLDLSCIFQTAVVFLRPPVFFRPQLCLSDLSCVSENLVVFFSPPLCF